MQESFLLKDDASLLDALKAIDMNKKGFVIVVDDAGHLVGTVTDGDIRRALMVDSKNDIKFSSIIRRNCKRLNVQDGISIAIESFKNERIKFLPIVDDNNCVVNVITKYQLHALLLQDVSVDLLYDFGQVDEGIIDHEIYQRPWGFYKTTIMNAYCQSKLICIYPEAQLSLQTHNYREEHWIVVNGFGKVQIGESLLEAKCGSTFFIPKGCKHRISNVSSKENLIMNEVQIGSYFGEDDIQRYEDIYGRV